MVSQANPPELDQVEDLASLISVNESSVLNTLLQRYKAQLPHTCTGPDLIVLQPRGPSAPSAGKVRWDHGGQGWGAEGRGVWGEPSASEVTVEPSEPPVDLSASSILLAALWHPGAWTMRFPHSLGGTISHH